jgi:hypothetical protein
VFDFIRRWMRKPEAVIAPVDLPPAPVTAKREPKGIRNRNPGNVRYTGEQWQGLAGVDPDGFCIFSTPQMGIRALCIVLLNYQRKHSLYSVRQMINRWAPPEENNTSAYAHAVARALDVDPDEPLRLDRDMLLALARAIIKHECGVQPYAPFIVEAGVDAALSA